MASINKDLINTILIVDDSSTARMILKKCFTISGFDKTKYFFAKNGEEALFILKDSKVDLIVTDINMPVMDGLEMIEKLKSNDNLKNIPVIVISSIASNSRVQEINNLGVDLIIEKPLNPHKIIELINTESDDGF